MASRKTYRLYIILIVFCLSILVYTLSVIIYSYGFNKLEPRKYTRINLNVPRMNYTITKEEAKEFVKNLYNTSHFYIETDKLSATRYAECSVILRTVKIKKNLNIVDYVTSYAHELTHLKYLYADETLTTFKAFVILYESGNEEIKNMALMDAQSVINGLYRGTEYDCGYYIIEYLKEMGYFEKDDI